METEEEKELADFDFVELDRVESQLRQLLEKEKDAHAKTKVLSLFFPCSFCCLSLRRK